MVGIEVVGRGPELGAAVAGAEVGHDQGVGRQVVTLERGVAHRLVHEAGWRDVGKPLNLLEHGHGVGQLSVTLPGDVGSLAADGVKLSLDALLDRRVAGEDAEGPAQHHRLGLGADNEELPQHGRQALLGERLLAFVDGGQVGVLQVARPVAAVLLPMLADPLLGYLVEPVAIIAALLNLGDRLGEDLGENGEEGEDGGPRHELGDLVDTLVDGLELLLLGVQPSPAPNVPKNVDDAHVELVAYRDRLRQLLGKVQFQVHHLVAHRVVETEVAAGDVRQPLQILCEEGALSLPVSALRRRDPGLALLEEGAREVARPAGELWPAKSLLDYLVAVEHDNRSAADKHGENVAVFFGQLVERLAEVAHVEVGQGAEEGEAGRPRREVSGSQRSLYAVDDENGK